MSSKGSTARSAELVDVWFHDHEGASVSLRRYMIKLVTRFLHFKEAGLMLTKLTKKEWMATEEAVSAIEARVVQLLCSDEQLSGAGGIARGFDAVGAYVYRDFRDRLVKMLKEANGDKFRILRKILKRKDVEESVAEGVQTEESILARLGREQSQAANPECKEEKAPAEEDSDGGGKKKKKKKDKKKKDKKKKSKAPKMKKADLIRLENSKKLLEKSFVEVCRALDTNLRHVILSLRHAQPVEFRLIQLMLAAQHIDEYEWIMMAWRTLATTKRIPGVSTLAVEDAELMLETMKYGAKFSFETLNSKAPHLVVNSETLLSSVGDVRLRDFQERIRALPWFDKGKPFLCLLHAMIGYGKTISAVGIAHRAHQRACAQYSRYRSTRDPNTVFSQMMFVCAVPTVRLQFARFCHAAGVPYSFVNWDRSGNTIMLRSSFACVELVSDTLRKKDLRRRSGRKRRDHNNKEFVLSVVITDLVSSLHLLASKSKEQLEETVVFLDEPTVAADQPESGITSMVAGVLARGVGQMVLSSATLPLEDEMDAIIKNYRRRFSNGQVVQIRAMNSQIGCQLVTLTGNYIAPHTGIASRAALKRMISRVKEEPFVRRLYSPAMVFTLMKTMIGIGIGGVFDMETYLAVSPDRLSHHEFVCCAVRLLERLLTHAEKENDDEVVQTVCSMSSMNTMEERRDVLDYLFTFDNDNNNNNNNQEGEGEGEGEENKEGDFGLESKSKKDAIVIRKLLTTQVDRFNVPTLLASRDALKMAQSMLNGLCTVKRESGRRTLRMYEKAFAANLRQYTANKEKQERDLANLATNKEIRSRNELRQARQNIESQKIVPDTPLLAELVPESVPWAEARGYPRPKDKVGKVFGCSFESVTDYTDVQEWLLLLLMAGVGVYGEDPALSPAYKTYVAALASRGDLRFIVSDDSIIYGTDWPIGIVICCDDISEGHSIASLMQLYGRAGRVGKCYSSFAYASNKVHGRLMRFIYGEDRTGTTMEGKNLCESFNAFLEFEEKLAAEAQQEGGVKLTEEEQEAMERAKEEAEARQKAEEAAEVARLHRERARAAIAAFKDDGGGGGGDGDEEKGAESD